MITAIACDNSFSAGVNSQNGFVATDFITVGNGSIVNTNSVNIGLNSRSRSVVIGGKNIVASADDTVYVPHLSVNDFITLSPQASAPTAETGRIYFDSSTSRLYCYDGTVWRNLF